MTLSRKFILYFLIEMYFVHSNAQKDKHYFRDDYYYLGETFDSFYKGSSQDLTWDEAKIQCENEGATLFYPQTEAEAKSALEVLKTQVPKFDSQYVFIGIRDPKGDNCLETVDGGNLAEWHNSLDKRIEPGQPKCLVIALTARGWKLWAQSCDVPLYFMCKKTRGSLQWNDDCDIPKSNGTFDYVYNGKLNKCYKFHVVPQLWHAARKVCEIEQSKLAVINSQAEADFLVELTKKVPSNIEDLEVLCLGFYNDRGIWKTLEETTLEDSGYLMWAFTQPDGGNYEECGAMSYNSRLHDMDCEKKCFFVCEHDIKNKK